MILREGLNIVTHQLFSVHLGLAIDQYHRSRLAKAPQSSSQPSRYQIAEHGSTLSSILHAFCAIESFCNFFGCELFSNEDSNIYIPAEKRDFLLARFARSWASVPLVDRFIYLITVPGKGIVSSQLECRLRELNVLRNMIAHGVAYTTTLLLEPGIEANTYHEIDMEDSIEWSSKFPNTKFKPIVNSGHLDARVALGITLEAIHLLSDKMNQPVHFFLCDQDPRYHVIFREDFDFVKYLGEP
jgi:hypothetical protein